MQGAGGGHLEANAIATLEASDLVEWVSAGYRGAQTDSAVFAVNPTRIYAGVMGAIPLIRPRSASMSIRVPVG